MRTAVLLLAMLVGSATATSYLSLSLDEMFSRAEIAFVGTVRGSSVEPRDDLPWTVVEFEVERWLTGDADRSELLSLAFLGGDLPSGELRVGLMPVFEVGERVLVLAYQEEYYSPLVGFNQGLWRIGDQALIDERGRRLSLDEQGQLISDGPPRQLELVIDAAARELGTEP